MAFQSLIMTSQQFIEHSCTGVDYTLFHGSWVPSSPRLVAAGTTLQNRGVIHIYSLGRELVKKQEVNMEFGLNAVTFRGSSLTDRRLAAGDFGGRVYSYDFEAGKEVWGLRGHEVVNCIDGGGGGGLGALELVTGGREGSVKVWDIREAKRPVVTMEPETGKRECWAVTVGNSYNDTEVTLTLTLTSHQSCDSYFYRE